MSRRNGRLRQVGIGAAVFVVGLGLGLGGISVYRSTSSGGHPSRTPSVKRFSFGDPTVASTPVAAPIDPAGVPDAEPADAVAALIAFLQAEATGRHEVAWTLLDAAGRQRWPTASAWTAAQAERAAPITFDVKAPAADTSTGDVDLGVDVTRAPSLDPFRSLVAARSAEVWRVHNESGHWRVVASPVESRPLLPADSGAPDAVRAWVDAVSACDHAGAVRLQVDANLLGPADVASAPCRQKGTWAVGSPVTVDRGGDVQALLATYGQGAASWARLVPVEGAGRRFWAEVAPVGDAWMVVGVTAGD